MKVKTALVVDVLGELGGAEKTLLAAMELFPGAPVYSIMYNPAVYSRTELANRRVFTSFIDHLPKKNTYYRQYLPLMPWAIEQFDLSEYDLILSFSYAVAHGVKVRPGQTHISYTHTPMRYAWRDFQINSKWALANPVKQSILRYFRSWDLNAAGRVNKFASSSYATQSWVQKAYQRTSKVIYPPVDVHRFTPRPDRQDYYITVSRLAAHKRIDVVVEAFSRLNLPLLVVGEGPELLRLRQMAAGNIDFTGHISDERLAGLLASAKAFVSSAEEDFGIAIVEAQAAGCPVIAYGKGGALETVVEGQTGLFFDAQSVDSLVEAVLQFQQLSPDFCPEAIRSHAQRFGKARFLDELSCFVQPSY